MKNPLLFALAVLSATLAHAQSDPRKLDDPEALRKSVPALAEMRYWRDFATPEQQALYDGPETVYPEVPASEYDLSGFDPAMLGSAVPAPGVHPRILFSAADLPMLKQRIEGSRAGRKVQLETNFILSHTLYDPASDEGKIYAKLVAGDTADLKWEVPPPAKDAAPTAGSPAPDHWFVGYKKQLAGTTHVAYLPNLFVAAAFQCQLNGDEKRGREVAQAIANYYALREPVVDKVVADWETTKTAPQDYWRAIFPQVGGNSLAFCYDLCAPWMTEAQRAPLRRLVAKATANRLAYGMNGPARWAETNWVGWDMEHFVTALAIEGEEGFNPYVIEAARRTLKGYLQWGINENGTIFESNGKNGGGVHYAALTMIAFARRGENFFGHPHWRKLPVAQAQSVPPVGGVNVNNGTWGCAKFGMAHLWVDFFPKDDVANFLLRENTPELATLDLDKYRRDLEGADGKPGINWSRLNPLTPAHLLGPTPYSCVDWRGLDAPQPADPAADKKATAALRAGLALPNDSVDTTHGQLNTRSGDDADALYMMFEARPDLHTIGHQQHDAGHFYLASGGEMWGVEGGAKSGFSVDHSVVRIDGLGLADVAYPPHVKFIASASTAGGALATADITNAYNYGWVGPTQFQWVIPPAKDWKITPETDPEILDFFRGTQNYKMRIWGDHYYKQNWGPTMRVASANPVKSAFRTAGIVRGKHPYALVLDDTDKGDGQEHLYDWIMQVPASVSLAQLSLPKGNPAAAVLVKTPGNENWRSVDMEETANGAPALMMVLLDVPVTTAPQLWNFVSNVEQPIRLETRTYAGVQPGQIVTRSRVIVSRRAPVLRSRIAFIPFRIGDKLPSITWDAAKSQSVIEWKDQKDTLDFPVEDARTDVTVTRDGAPLLATPKSSE